MTKTEQNAKDRITLRWILGFITIVAVFLACLSAFNRARKNAIQDSRRRAGWRLVDKHGGISRFDPTSEEVTVIDFSSNHKITPEDISEVLDHDGYFPRLEQVYVSEFTYSIDQASTLGDRFDVVFILGRPSSSKVEQQKSPKADERRGTASGR